MTLRRQRLWWGLGCMAVAIFAAYISLVPFRFVPPPATVSILQLIRSSLTFEVRSLSNLAANGIMFVPFGVCGLGVFVVGRSRWGLWCLAVGVTLTTSLMLSIGIEVLQIFVRGRTPSLTDVAAQTIGTVVGMAVFAIARGSWASRVTSRSNQGRGVVLALGLYAVLLFIVLLFDPSSASRRSEGLTSWMSDVMLAVPIGVLAALASVNAGTRRPLAAALVAAAVFFLTAQLGEAVVRSGVINPLGVVPSGIGAALGVVVARAGVGTGHGVMGFMRPRIVAHAGLLVATLAYVVYNLTPFDFSVSREMMETRIGLLTGVPFHGHYQNQEFKALRDLFVKASLALPLGIFFHQGSRPDPARSERMTTMLWLLLTAVFFSAVELGQVFLPSRYPDNTDIVLATGAAWLGILLGRSLPRDRARQQS